MAMKNVIGVSLGARRQDFRFDTTFLGERLHVRRLGADGSADRAAKLLRYWDRRAAAIGLGLVRDSDELGRGSRDAAGAIELAEAVQHAPLTTGARLAEIFLEWAVRHAQVELGHYFDNARVLFFSGVANHKLALAMAEYTPNLRFADPLRPSLTRVSRATTPRTNRSAATAPCSGRSPTTSSAAIAERSRSGLAYPRLPGTPASRIFRPAASACRRACTDF